MSDLETLVRMGVIPEIYVRMGHRVVRLVGIGVDWRETRIRQLRAIR